MSGFDGETTAPAVAMLMASALLDVDQLAGQDPGRYAVVASVVPAPPGDRLIERRAFALVQLPALLRRLLQLACACAYRPLFGASRSRAGAVRCTARRPGGRPISWQLPGGGHCRAGVAW